jgi:hypothetical protein
LFFPRIDFHQNHLRQRHQGCPKDALQKPSQNNLCKRIRHAAQRGGHGEAGNGSEEADSVPCMCGKATLAMVLSRVCMIGANMIENVIMGRLSGRFMAKRWRPAPGFR